MNCGLFWMILTFWVNPWMCQKLDDQLIMQELAKIRATLDQLARENMDSDEVTSSSSSSGAVTTSNPSSPSGPWSGVTQSYPDPFIPDATRHPAETSVAPVPDTSDRMMMSSSTTAASLADRREAVAVPGSSKTFADLEAEEELFKVLPAKPFSVRRKFLQFGKVMKEAAALSRRMFFAKVHGLPAVPRTACPIQNQVKCDPEAKYRSIDGLCNNLEKPLWGSYLNAHERFLPAEYEDGFGMPRGAKYDPGRGYLSRLPSARAVTGALFHSKNVTDPSHTHLLMQFGQFLDHDIASTPKDDLDCCDERIRLTLRCFNVDLVGDDNFFKKHQRSCMEMTRAHVHCDPDRGHLEQFNVVTAFIDASTVYGSESEVAMALREKSDGKMKTNKNIPDFLPTRRDCGMSSDSPLEPDDLVSGDWRSQSQATLMSMHVLWLREHNRIAQNLKKVLASSLSALSPQVQDEILYQESRKILIAELQNIVYNEYLVQVLNPEIRKKHHLSLEADSTYFALVNPSIRNEFASAAYRYGHSQVQDVFHGLNQPWRLGRFFGDMIFAIRSNGQGHQMELEGAANQQCLRVDRFITKELTNNLFNSLKVSNDTKDQGSDLASINIQRGRDHGVPSYNSARKLVGLPSINSMQDRPPEISQDAWDALASVYKHPDDIDLYPGGLSEDPLDGGTLGPVFSFMVAEQFRVLKDGDRFFFTHGRGPKAQGLHPDVQRMIFERKLSDVICDNSQIQQIARNVMIMPSESNPKMACDHPSRARLDFEAIANFIQLSKSPSVQSDGPPPADLERDKPLFMDSDFPFFR